MHTTGAAGGYDLGFATPALPQWHASLREGAFDARQTERCEINKFREKIHPCRENPCATGGKHVSELEYRKNCQ